MSQNQNETDEFLTRELADTADFPRPIFSRELHEKIMSRIVSAQTGQHRCRRFRRLFIPSALAASVALIIGLIILMYHFNASNRSNSSIARVVRVPSVPTIQNPIRALELPVACQVAAADYADVDQDGEKLIRYMTRQLDVLPLRKSNDPVGPRE
jgi:hypothetical protein